MIFKPMRTMMGLGRVKIIGSSSAPLSPSLMEFLRVVCSHASIHEAYGMTETCGGLCTSGMIDTFIGHVSALFCLCVAPVLFCWHLFSGSMYLLQLLCAGVYVRVVCSRASIHEAYGMTEACGGLCTSGDRHVHRTCECSVLSVLFIQFSVCGCVVAWFSPVADSSFCGLCFAFIRDRFIGHVSIPLFSCFASLCSFSCVLCQNMHGQSS